MRWEGGRESENVEDRRRISPKGMAIGGGGAIVVVIIGLMLGLDPNQINRLLNNPPAQNQAGGGAAERPETPEEAQSRKFSATILGYSEDVWGELFRQAGKQYEPPKMVLFAKRV